MSTTTSSSVVVTRGAVADRPSRPEFGSLVEAVEAVAAVEALLASLAASRAVLMSEVGTWVSAHAEEVAGERAGDEAGTGAEAGPAEPARGEPSPGGAVPVQEVPAEEVAAEIVAERLAVVLRISPEGAASLVEESRTLVHQHPRTLAELRRGRISYGHAQTILGYTCGLRRASRTALETRLLKQARTVTVAELSRIAHDERERRLRVPRVRARRRAARPGSGEADQRPQMSSQAGGSPACT